MNCMKCGTTLSKDQVFCESCLAEMEKYPVRPGTAVHLPRRNTTDAAKKATVKKKAPTAEDKLRKMRIAVLWLSALVLVLSIALGAAVIFLSQHIHSGNPDETIGQNYSTISPEDLS